MKTIVITSPNPVDNEVEKLTLLLKSGIDFLHIRKPDYSARQMSSLIEAIPSYHHNRLRIHSNFELVDSYDLAGIHLNSRNNTPHPNAKSLTRSCHSIQELRQSVGYDYTFLSPIFDSISKQGYESGFRLDDLIDLNSSANIVALGGVTPTHFDSLKNCRFYGAALLGYVWENSENFTQIIDNINKHK